MMMSEVTMTQETYDTMNQHIINLCKQLTDLQKIVLSTDDGKVILDHKDWKDTKRYDQVIAKLKKQFIYTETLRSQV